MKSVLARSLFGLCCLTPVLLLFVAPDQRLSAQDAPKSDAKATKQRAEPRGRLPDHYVDVVDGEQREKIYAIQKKYEAEVKALEDQLAALNKKIDAEMAGVLRPEQVKKVEELRKDAMDKRKQRSAAAKQSAAPAADPAPAAKP